MTHYDLPAVFQYISNYTSNAKLDYLGHSQGSTIMHIALAEHYEPVLKYLGRYFAFGPVAYVRNQQSNVFSLLDKSDILAWYHIRHIYEFMPSLGWFDTDVGVIFCATFPKVCADILAEVMDADPNVDNY